MSEKHTTTDAVEILHRRYISNDPEMRQILFSERLKLKIGQKIYDLRQEAGLTQKQLAKIVGTTAEVISDLEMTDYEDNELSNAVLMLQRLALALDKQVEFQIVPLKARPTPTPPQAQAAIS